MHSFTHSLPRLLVQIFSHHSSPYPASFSPSAHPQADLATTFTNAMVYNAEGSEFYELGKDLLDQIPQVLENAMRPRASARSKR